MDALAEYATLVLSDPAVPDDFRAAVRALAASAEHVAPLDEFMCAAIPSARMVYIDAAILKTLAMPMGQESIGILDRAIIIAGAGDDDARRDYIVHDMIRRLQAAIPSRSPSSVAILIASRAPVALPLTTSRNGICALPALPSVLAPQAVWSRTPFLVRRYADEWPATKRWPSLEYLESVAGPARTVPVEIGHDYRSDQWTQQLISWHDFLHSLVDPPQQSIYLAQYSLFRQFPQLRDDIILPDIVYASLDTPDYPAYRHPRDVILNAWLGPEGTLSPAHTDPFFNCYVQVVGRKTAWLAPPNVAPAMYPHQSSVAESHNMSNTSQVDVFSDAIEPSFPLFSQTVPDQASSVTLNPGDLLFFPPGWWHAMRSEDASFSVSMWF